MKGEHAEQYAELASLLENYQYSYKVGDKVHGKVVACDTKGALVEIGAKADALVPTSECSLSAVKNVRRVSMRAMRCVRCDFLCASRASCFSAMAIGVVVVDGVYSTMDDGMIRRKASRGGKPCV